MRSANATAGPDDQLVLRIGINLGDIVESGDDLMGDAVNVAVRLESIAPHGGICVSAAIYEQIVGKLTLGAEDMGEQHVKNIPRPIHAYRLTPGGKTPLVTAAAPPPMRKASSRLVAVTAGVAAVAVVAIAGAWLMHERMKPTPPAAQAAAAPPATPATPAAAAVAAAPTAAPVGHFRIDRGSATAPGPMPSWARGSTTPPMCRSCPIFADRRSRITPRPKAPRRWRSMCAASSRSRRAASTIRRRATSPSRTATGWCIARCRSSARSTTA